jgi:hypothetical protein
VKEAHLGDIKTPQKAREMVRTVTHCRIESMVRGSKRDWRRVERALFKRRKAEMGLEGCCTNIGVLQGKTKF